jgi:hypothetical protein
VILLDKNKILEIQSKKNNDEYIKQITERSTNIAFITMLFIIIFLLIIDIIEQNPYNYKYILIVLGGETIGSLYKYIKIKSKKSLTILIFSAVAFLLHIVLFIVDVLK